MPFYTPLLSFLSNPGDQGEIGDEGDLGKLGKDGPPGPPGTQHSSICIHMLFMFGGKEVASQIIEPRMTKTMQNTTLLKCMLLHQINVALLKHCRKTDAAEPDL